MSFYDALIYIKMKITLQCTPKYLANLPLHVFTQPLTFTSLPETQGNLYSQDKPLIQDLVHTVCTESHACAMTHTQTAFIVDQKRV